jgi:hypothetical protein
LKKKQTLLYKIFYQVDQNKKEAHHQPTTKINNPFINKLL